MKRSSILSTDKMTFYSPVPPVIIFVLVWLLALPLSEANAIVIPIESATHHLGNDVGNEGTSFQKDFTVSVTLTDATLEFDFVLPFGPNLESPPRVFNNGVSPGSLSPFFPPLDVSDPQWQTNPDGSHDYNGGFHVSLPVTPFLVVGTNTFLITNGRADDDYFFADVFVEGIPAIPKPIKAMPWLPLLLDD